jgi:hypothetical protein
MMRMEMIACRTRLKATYNLFFRRNGGMLIGLAVILLSSIALTIWSLLGHIQQWQAAGEQTFNAELWQLCLGIWSGIGFFTLLNTVQLLWRDDGMILLFTLPMTPTTLFRICYGYMLIDLWNWLLLQTISVGGVLLLKLGWSALFWVVLLELGSGCVAFFMMIGVLFFVRYVMLATSRERIAGVALTAVLLLGLVSLLVWLVMHIQQRMLMLQPELLIVGCILLLAGVLGPLAPVWGRLYATTFYQLQSLDRSPRPRLLPGMRTLKGLLAQSRTLCGALVLRAMLSQSQHWFFWLRFVVAIILLVLAPIVHTLLLRIGLSNLLFVIGYITLVTVGPVVETLPNAISAEGQRFALYLIMPVRSGQILRAKFLLYMIPLLCMGMVCGSILSWLFGLTIVQGVYALVAIALMIWSLVALPVLGSVWDLNLKQQTGGMEQAILQEEGPFSFRRMLLFYLCVVLWAALFMLLWKLPMVLALGCFVVLAFVVTIVGYCLSLYWMGHLVRNG